MPDKTIAKPALLMLGVLAASLSAASCGNFWTPPSGTSSTGTTASSTTLTPSTSTPTVNESVILTATVTPSAATGTVTFYNNSAEIGTGTLSDGTATYTASFASAGTASLTATYGGSSTYTSSTSSAVSVTVSAASNAVRAAAATAANDIQMTAYGSSPIHAAQAFTVSGGTFTAQNAEAVVVDTGGSAALSGTRLAGAAGAGRGVLLERGAANSDATARFTMMGGSLAYTCVEADGCADTSGLKQQSAVFAVADANAVIALTDVTVNNATATEASREGTLLTVAAAQNGRSGASAAFTAKGTNLTGDVVAEGSSMAAVELLSDDAGTASSLIGKINAGNTARGVSLTLDAASSWTVTGSSYLSSLSGVDLQSGTASNIDGGGHCVFYSGTVNGMSGVTLALSGGGFLAPAGTTGLACH